MGDAPWFETQTPLDHMTDEQRVTVHGLAHFTGLSVDDTRFALSMHGIAVDDIDSVRVGDLRAANSQSQDES